MLEGHQIRTAEAVSSQERTLRNIYRLVITISSLYFYVSMPFLIILILGLVAGLGYLFLSVGRVPVRLALFILLAAVATLYSILRSVFARARSVEPGVPLSSAEAPELWAALEEVAGFVGTRPVDKIYITAGPEIGVSEQGGILKRLNDKSVRYLVLGLGSLPDMSQGQFKAVLAHEYGHFSHGDTTGGQLAYQVSHSIQHMVIRLAMSGQARWYNPAWIFLNGYYRVFLGITRGASRLQEYLADRFAALAFGVEVLKTALIQIVRNSAEFNEMTNREIVSAVNEGRYLNNIYQLSVIDDPEVHSRIENAFEGEMSRKTSPFDTHPSMADRIAALNSLDIEEKQHDHEQPAEDLLPTLEKLQMRMTARIQEQLDKQPSLKQAAA